MAFIPRTIQTRCATMALIAPGYIEQRFRNDVTLDRLGFEENRRVRAELGGQGPYVMHTIIPEGIDFELDITMQNHFAPERGRSGLVALAVTASDAMGEAVAKLYFSYFPPDFQIKVFSTEAQAKAWLEERRPIEPSPTDAG